MLGIIKSDVRYEYLSKMFDDSIISNKLLDFYNVDELVLPIGGVNDDYTIKQTNINLLDLLKQNSIKRIYSANNSKRLEELCKENQIELVNLFDNESIIKNAKLTAKGIIHYLGNDDKDISEYKVLVVGYGNIGYYLCKILELYEVKYSVYTLNETEKKYLISDNKSVINELSGNGFDIIINTIPHNLNWDYASLSNVKIIDIASKPYGFDVEKIINYKLNYYILSAIPSKYCPHTAATIFKNCIK